ncbi:hypothetical protein HYC85_023635 [Camellia sinensis]|uniref:Uncharacterized protein n=1 Tax=Camellia sinensis TaxID=4442 RepID=A0A7J7GIZ7_CAMSI|nr:hypothetical protein HYC85_023635 [Camellia sinensis]
MEELKITLEETISIRPSKQPERQTIQLSGLDRISPAILYTIFFYKSQFNNEKTSSSSSDDVVDRAKTALQKVLISWFPTAGRLRINAETEKLEIDCNNQGVTAITAKTGSKLEELGRLCEYKPCYEKLVPQLPDAEDISKNPLVVVQITRFACGGFSIGFGSSHTLFDGIGAFNFLASWAHIATGKDESDLIVPNHSRNALLNAICTPYSTPMATSIYEQDHIAAIQDLYRIPMQAMASDDRRWETELAKFSQIDPQGGLQLISLSIKKEVVEAWKELVIERGKLLKCSTFDLLCAQIWKAS